MFSVSFLKIVLFLNYTKADRALYTKTSMKMKKYYSGAKIRKIFKTTTL